MRIENGTPRLDGLLADVGSVRNDRLPAFNSAKGLSVSADLGRFAGVLGVEVNEASSRSARSSLSSAFARVIALVSQNVGIARENIEALDEAGRIGAEIDAVEGELAELEGRKSALERMLEDKGDEISRLEEERDSTRGEISIIDSELEDADGGRAEELKARKEELGRKLSHVENRLSEATVELSQIQDVLGGMRQKIAERMSERDMKRERMKQALARIRDEEILRRMAEAMRMDASDVQGILVEKEAERDEQEEKWLEENSPVRVILSMLDEVAERRDEMV